MRGSYLTGVLILVCIVGCKPRASATRAPAPPNVPAAGTAPAGMKKFPYLAADGGPHMLLPAEAAGAWKAISSPADVTNPQSDYGRACAAVTTARMAPIPVGSSSALIFNDPPMSAWGKSADGLVEIYNLQSWTSTDLDALLAKATAALPTASMKKSGTTLRLPEPDAFLLYAGDAPGGTAYGVHRVTIPAGNYDVLAGTYSAGGESVEIYRLKPAGP
jgi:hypothetical protein